MAQVITRCRLTGHYMFMGMDADPKEFARSPGPFKRKFCPFCACDHLWHKEDSKFLAPKPPPRVGIQQASWTKTSTARRRKACADDLPDTPFTER